MDTKLEKLSSRDLVIYIDIFHNHNGFKVYDCIYSKKIPFVDNEGNRIKIETELLKLLHEGYKILVIIDPEYPKDILNSYHPPVVIYYKGDEKTISKRYFDKTSTQEGISDILGNGCFLE